MKEKPNKLPLHPLENAFTDLNEVISGEKRRGSPESSRNNREGIVAKKPGLDYYDQRRDRFEGSKELTKHTGNFIPNKEE